MGVAKTESADGLIRDLAVGAAVRLGAGVGQPFRVLKTQLLEGGRVLGVARGQVWEE